GARRADDRFTARVTNTVWHMAQGGIYDHLGGGFARYSVDAEWLVPHFEKMAYDNAGLIRLMTRLYQKTKQPLLKRRIEETIGWVSAELRHDRGGFWSSYDADSEGVEGKYYVWTDEEIDAALGPNAARFKTAYDVSPSGNWEGRTILNRSHVAQDDEAEEEVLAPLRATLTSIRKGRVPPGLDDKILTDWNGLMIAAYAEAALVFDRPDWLAAAAETYRFVQQELTGDGGRLSHAWREGKARHAGILDDYANMADAALQLFEASGNRTYIADAEAFAEQVDTHFADGQEGGYFLTADDAEALIVRTKSALDSPTPSGNGTMVGVLARLTALTGKTIYRDRAQAIVTAFSGKMDQHFWGLSTLLANLGYLHRPDQVVIIGDREDPATHALSRTAVERYLPTRILCLIEPDSALPEGHPAFGKNRVDDQPTAYYCPGQTCRAPVTDPADLAALLDGEGKP
ncbi:MAG: thioredoxin domain-containing protein, partial [Pseudomonadota bacterium]